MKFNLPCVTFARIANASLLDSDTAPNHDEPWLHSVRLERRNGSEFCVATTREILAVELIGNNDDAPDGFIHITNKNKFLNHVIEGAASDALLQIESAPGWTVARIGETYFPENVGLDGVDVVKDWRLLFAEEATKQPGAFGFNGKLLARIADASPSGFIVFPKVVDGRKFLVVNDIVDPDWMGLISSLRDGDEPKDWKPAIVKAWAK